MSRDFLCCLLSMMAALAVGLPCIVAQAEPQDGIGEPSPPTVVDEQQQRRQNTFTAGVLLLLGVLAVGLLLMAAAIVWGAKVRRLARRPEPGSARPDELWYLRKTRPPPEPGTSPDEKPPADDPAREP